MTRRIQGTVIAARESRRRIFLIVQPLYPAEHYQSGVRRQYRVSGVTQPAGRPKERTIQVPRGS